MKKKLIALIHILIVISVICGTLIMCGFSTKTSSNFDYAVSGGSCASDNGGAVSGCGGCLGSTCSIAACGTGAGCLVGCIEFDKNANCTSGCINKMNDCKSCLFHFNPGDCISCCMSGCPLKIPGINA